MGTRSNIEILKQYVPKIIARIFLAYPTGIPVNLIGTRKCRLTQLGTTADRHTVSRLTYNMSIDIQYVNQHTHHVCRSRYCMSINIQYVDRHTCIDVSRSTYSMSIDIHYVDRHTWCVCRSTYCMSIDILYVNRDTVCRLAVVPNCYMRGIRRISCMTSVWRFWRFYVIFYTLTSFARQFLPNVSPSTYKRGAVPNFSWSKNVIILE